MSQLFNVGSLYNRRKDIHSVYGGQQQGGIVTPASHPLIFLFTADIGTTLGYADGWNKSGRFEYFGAGPVGDMQLARGNRAIANHIEDGKDLHLFEKEKSGDLRYLGQFVCERCKTVQAIDTNGNNRSAFVFELVPIESIDEPEQYVEASKDVDLHVLRQRAIEAAVTDVRSTAASISVRQRSDAVRIYVLARAQGRCECCGKEAPFVRPDGSPYLEPHHIRRLSDGGPDDPRHVIALCPNCHRRAHYSREHEIFNAKLAERLMSIETSVSE